MNLFVKILASALVTAWCLAGVWYYSTITSYPTTQEIKTDAIVILTGGSGRLSSGGSLFLKNRAAHLFVTGVNTVTTKKDLRALLNLDAQQINTSVTLGYEAKDTEGNAKETKQWALQNNVTSIALVTAHYHMPRSLVAFRSMLKGVEITPVAATPALFRAKGKFFKKFQVLFFEYNKFLLATLKSFIMD